MWQVNQGKTDAYVVAGINSWFRDISATGCRLKLCGGRTSVAEQRYQ